MTTLFDGPKGQLKASVREGERWWLTEDGCRRRIAQAEREIAEAEHRLSVAPWASGDRWRQEIAAWTYTHKCAADWLRDIFEKEAA